MCNTYSFIMTNNSNMLGINFLLTNYEHDLFLLSVQLITAVSRCRWPYVQRDLMVSFRLWPADTCSSHRTWPSTWPSSWWARWAGQTCWRRHWCWTNIRSPCRSARDWTRVWPWPSDISHCPLAGACWDITQVSAVWCR